MKGRKDRGGKEESNKKGRKEGKSEEEKEDGETKRA